MTSGSGERNDGDPSVEAGLIEDILGGTESEEGLLEAAVDQMLDAMVMDSLRKGQDLRDVIAEDDARQAAANLTLPNQDQFIADVLEGVDVHNVPPVRAVAYKLIDHLEEAGVLDMRTFYGGQIRYEVGAILQTLEDRYREEIRAFEAEDDPSQVQIDPVVFVREYLRLDDPMTLLMFQYMIKEAISEGEKLHLQAETVSRAKAHERALGDMEQKAYMDIMTQLWNRTAFEECIASIVEEDPDGRYFFLMLDLDKFKQVNDTFGHSSGDEILKAFATVIREYVRGGSKAKEAFRIGGEEMVVLCRLNDDISLEDAQRAALERADLIRKGMEARGFQLKRLPQLRKSALLAKSLPGFLGRFAERVVTRLDAGGGRKLVRTGLSQEENPAEAHQQTVSIGVALGLGRHLADDGDNSPMYRSADAALYTAKESGRNRVELGESLVE